MCSEHPVCLSSALDRLITCWLLTVWYYQLFSPVLASVCCSLSSHYLMFGSNHLGNRGTDRSWSVTLIALPFFHWHNLSAIYLFAFHDYLMHHWPTSLHNIGRRTLIATTRAATSVRIYPWPWSLITTRYTDNRNDDYVCVCVHRLLIIVLPLPATIIIIIMIIIQQQQQQLQQLRWKY